ncbi:hypothetical protein SAMN06264346_10822 [Chryseobacterium profundimaris]|uniref:Uncharacterized protein n=1 Tax=Chryseobacterium profundimaris TaxID=1387275 RepID=A0ABY1P1Y1_9FLAO|nr:hypothetical protein SAMN06264346_10822 [Chryseobacterium profundimaris]
MFFGPFDYIILIITVIFNSIVWKYEIIKKRNWIFYLVAFLLFSFIIPVFSIYFEVQRAIKGQLFVDNFTLLYTYFRFPIWWMIGLLEVIWLKFYLKIKIRAVSKKPPGKKHK